MGQVSLFLRKTSAGYCYFCPGCRDIHCVNIVSTRIGAGPVWGFNGNVDRPSFTPSVRHFNPAHKDPETGVDVPEKTFCHYHVTDGEIRYCNDCEHELNGKTIPLPPLPPEYSDENYGWPP